MKPPVPPHVASVETFFVAVGVAAVEVRVDVTRVELETGVEVRVDVETGVDDELDTTAETLYVLNEAICQYAFRNEPGFSATYFLQESMPLKPLYIGHPLSAYTFPAQSPQKVVSKMNLWSLNLVFMSHAPSKLALGIPKVAVSGAPAVMLVGILLRGNNHTLMDVLVHSMA